MILRHTGSQLDRIARCEASAAMPQIIDANDEDRDDRDKGTVVHRFLDRVPEIGREAAINEADEKLRPVLQDIELAKLADQLKLSREVAHRAYEVDPDCEVPLTADLVGTSYRTVYVGDYKGPHGWLPAPENSFQLAGGAVAFSRLFNATRAHLEYIRILDDGTPRFYRGELDAFALEAAADRIRTLMQNSPELRARYNGGEVLDVVEGRWCRYCPARQFCPAKTAMIRSVLSAPAKSIPYDSPITPANAQAAYKVYRAAKDALAQFESALFSYAKTTAIPIGLDEDGSQRYFGELVREGNDVLDGAKTHQVLTELYGGEAANKAVKMETTKKAVTDVVRAHLQPGEKITKKTDEVFETIKERGGISNPITVSTTEYTVSVEGLMKARKRKAS